MWALAFMAQALPSDDGEGMTWRACTRHVTRSIRLPEDMRSGSREGCYSHRVMEWFATGLITETELPQ